MSIPDWDLKRVYREIIMVVIVGLLGWASLQLTEMKILQAESAVRIEECMKVMSAHDRILETHEIRIRGLEIDVNTLKVQTAVP